MATYDQRGNKITNNNEQKTAAIFHLVFFTNFLLPFFITSLVILVIIKAVKDNWSDYLNDQWREAINFNLTMLVYTIVFGLLCIIFIGIPLIIALVIYGIVMPVIAAIKVLDMQDFKYPWIHRFI